MERGQIGSGVGNKIRFNGNLFAARRGETKNPSPRSREEEEKPPLFFLGK